MKTKLLARGPVIINGGGTINSIIGRRGSLGPQPSIEPEHVNSPVLCDSSQILLTQLNLIIDVISQYLQQSRPVIFMMGTDNVGPIGDALKNQLPPHYLNSPRFRLVLAAAMKPEHKDAVLAYSSSVTQQGISIVVSSSTGRVSGWSLTDISLHKTGKDLDLPFELNQSKNGYLESPKVPHYLNHPSLLLVLPTIHNSVEEVCDMITTALGNATPSSSTIVLVGYGLFNFPAYPPILEVLETAQRTCNIMVSTRTEAYFIHSHEGHTPYEPLQTLMNLGILPLHSKNLDATLSRATSD